MPSLQEKLRLLDHAPLKARVSILLEAAQHAEIEELPGLVEAMMASADPQAVAWLIKNAHRLEKSSLTLLDDAPFSISPGIGHVVVGQTEQHQLNAIAAIARRAEAELAVHLCDLIEIGSETVQAAAAEALLDLAADGGRGRVDPSAHARMDRAVARAVREYRSNRLDALLIAAAIQLRTPGKELTALLDDPNLELAVMLRSAVAKTSNPHVRRNLLRWLILDEIGPAAARSLPRLSGAVEFSDLLECGYLARTPARKRMLRRVDHSLKCLPSIAQVGQMSVDAQSHLPQLAMSLGLTQEQRVSFLADCIAVPSALGRLNAIRELDAFDSEDSRKAAARFSLDRWRPVSSIAVGHALRRPDAAAIGILARLAAGSDRTLRPQAARVWRAVARHSVDAFFEHWRRVDADHQLAAGLSLLAGHRGEVLDRLKRLLAGGDRQTRLEAVALGRRLRVVADLSEELIELMGSADSRIAATAASALGDLRGEAGGAGVAALQDALEHDDARVRANSIESLVRAGAPGVAGGADRIIEILIPMCESRHNRSRANAIRGVVRHRPPDGLEHLSRMLRDEDPAHRTSAIWAAGRCAVSEAVRELRHVAAGDEQPDLRARAQAAMSVLERFGPAARIVQEAVP